MRLSKDKLIELALPDVDSLHLAECIANRILEAESKLSGLVARLDSLRLQKQKIKQVCEAKLKQLEAEIVSVQRECNHEWEVNHDPSGGRDHDCHCRFCGVEHP